MAVCAICGGKARALISSDLKDGKCCLKCIQRFESVGFVAGKSWDSGDFTAQEAKDILENPEKWRSIAKERKERREITSANCLICGKSFGRSYKYMTSDGYALCLECRNAAITISPQEFLQEKDNYIKRHDSLFFKENMEHVDHPHPALYVNFTKQMFFYGGEWIDGVDSVFSFDSVIKFESEDTTYEVTVGKKGHPIARAVAGGALFGGAGAVVGAMTSKNTKHKETREGRKCISIYHRDSLKPDTVRKRTCYCDRDEDVVKLEECLKNVFEYRDSEQQYQEEPCNEATKNELASNYAELVELKKLLDMGVITQEEFDTKKKQILGL